MKIYSVKNKIGQTLSIVADFQLDAWKARWMKLHPNATPADTIGALELVEENNWQPTEPKTPHE